MHHMHARYQTTLHPGNNFNFSIFKRTRQSSDKNISVLAMHTNSTFILSPLVTDNNPSVPRPLQFDFRRKEGCPKVSLLAQPHPQYFYPHTSLAISTINFNLAHCCSSASLLP